MKSNGPLIRTKNGNKWTADEDRVQHRKDGEEVYLILLTKAKTEDAGKYVATLKNVEGQVTTEGSIIVNSKYEQIINSLNKIRIYVKYYTFLIEFNV